MINDQQHDDDRACCAILIISVCTLRFHFGMDVHVGRRKTPDGVVVAEWYPLVFMTNLTLAMAIDPGEVEVGGEDAAEEEAEDAHVQPALDQTKSLHRRMGRPAGLLLERVTALP